jgi:phenylpyruvate tautomerase PptA (4-oxalocrotonate tautomerase family)
MPAVILILHPAPDAEGASDDAVEVRAATWSSVMPYIQLDLREGLSSERKRALNLDLREAVHRAIGSAYHQINIVLREWPAENLAEAGETAANYAMGAGDHGREAVVARSQNGERVSH